MQHSAEISECLYASRDVETESDAKLVLTNRYVATKKRVEINKDCGYLLMCKCFNC